MQRFRGEKGDFPGVYGGLFDVYNANKSFKLDPGGFGAEQRIFARIPAGLTWHQIHDELQIDGSLVGGGSIYAATGGLNLYVDPEPSSIVLLGIGSLALLTRRRRSMTLT